MALRSTSQNDLAWPDQAASDYAVQYETSPPGPAIDVQGTLAGGIDGITSRGAQITSTLDVPFENNQARAFSCALHGQPLKGLVFVNGRTFYVLLAGGPSAVAQSDRFFNALGLNP